ncbi:putative bacteriophage protein [Avibacterium paragallinarum]|uniref:Putative bacteriophage protein n=2 Tax=Avibacterium paragallinarum TaxID=728 RepID=A0A377IWA0_AVIPA|nr:putative bacteriophage protein [Avibacterium paragallinarum]
MNVFMMARILNYIVPFIRKYSSLLWLCVILGLCGWVWYQSQRISSLSAKNQMQAQTIQQLNHHLAEKTKQLEDERKTTQKQTALEQVQREKADEDIRVIYKTIKEQDCSREPLPDDVIKRLQHKN